MASPLFLSLQLLISSGILSFQKQQEFEEVHRVW